MLQAGAPVIVDFEDLALGGLDPVVIAVAALPPLSAAQGTAAEAVVVPCFDYVRDYVLPVTEAEGCWNPDFAAYSDLNLSTEELWSHDSSQYDMNSRRGYTTTPLSGSRSSLKQVSGSSGGVVSSPDNMRGLIFLK